MLSSRAIFIFLVAFSQLLCAENLYAEDVNVINVYGSQGFVDEEFTSVQELSAEDLQNKPSSELKDVFDNFQNVSVTGGPRNDSSDITIRGFDSKRILFVLDGARQNLRSTHSGGLLIEPLFLEEVKVYSGASSVNFGAGSIGGTVILKTISPKSFIIENSLGGHVTGIHESANELLGAGAFNYGRLKNFGYLIGATFRNTGDSKLSNDTTLPYSAYNQHAQLFKINTKLYNNEVTFGFENYSQKSLTRSAANLELSFDDEVEDERYRQSFTLQALRKTESASRKINLSYNISSLQEHNRRTKNDDERTTTTTGLDLVYKKNFSKFDYTTGLNLVYDDSHGERNKGASDFEFFPGGFATTAGVFISSKLLMTSKTKLLSGVRYDDFRLQSDSSKTRDNDFNFHIGLSHDWVKSLNTTFVYSESFNPPRVQEVFPDGEHFLGNEFVPNPNLKPEKSKSWELKNKLVKDSLFFKNDYFEVSSNLYLQVVDNYIEQEITGTTTQFVNVGTVQARGHETSVTYNIKSIEIKTAFNTVRSDNKNTGHPLASAPADEVAVSIKYKRPLWYLGARHKHVEAQNRVHVPSLIDVTKLPTKSYNLYGLSAGYEHRYGTGKKILFNLNIDNLFNENYKPHGDDIPAKRQNIYVNISAYF